MKRQPLCEIELEVPCGEENTHPVRVGIVGWGKFEVVKSTFVESLERNGFPVLTMIASLHDPTDFNGLPTLKDGWMHFAPPDWVYAFEATSRASCFWTS